MARNGSGTYSLYTPGNPVVTGTTISSTAFNNTMNDIATALTLSIASDGQTPITANIPMASHKITGLAAGTTSGDALAYGQSSASLASLTVTTTLTGPTGVITSGTYTPTLTSVANVTSSTAHQCQYMRVGNVVTVSGLVGIRATSVGATTSLAMSLPIASNFNDGYECGGTAKQVTEMSTDETGVIVAEAVNNRVELAYYSAASGVSRDWVFHYTYLVL